MENRKFINGHPFVLYNAIKAESSTMKERTEQFYHLMQSRRSCRDFSAEPVSKEIIEQIIETASTAPSGAHKQPWTFCVVSSPVIKKQIRLEAEQEEKENYGGRLSADWLTDLLPLQTSWEKPFLETAPYLIIVFKKSYEPDSDGRKRNTYYALESCGIACGFLLAAVQFAGLAALTHTPSPMNFLSKILNRPENEKPFLVIPVGYPAPECWVPDIERKKMEQVSVFYD